MRLALTDEQKMLRDSLERFAARQLQTPLAAADDRGGAAREIRQALIDLGLWSLTAPAEVGGSGFDLASACLAIEALARRDAGAALTVAFHLGLIVPALTAAANIADDDQLRRSIDGTVAVGVVWPALTNSQPAPLAATKQAGHWVLDGAATALVPAEGAEALLVLAIDGAIDDDDDGLISTFLVHPEAFAIDDVDADSRGDLPALGLHGPAQRALELDRARLAPAHLLATPTSRTSLPGTTSLALASLAIGIGDAALAEAINYADERRQFGRSINQFQAIRFKLADMATDLEMARWSVLRAAASPDTTLNELALRSSVEAALGIADEALQIHGGYGYTEEYPVERLYRDSRQLSLLATTWLTLLRDDWR